MKSNLSRTGLAATITAVALTFLSLIPGAALAQQPEDAYGAADVQRGNLTEQLQTQEGNADSGECGSGVTYQYEDGTLTISGTGPMSDYRYIEFGPGSTAPWQVHRYDIKKLVVEEGVTTLGDFWG